MTAYSHLGVLEYQVRLRKATVDDAYSLYRDKAHFLKLTNLLNHTPEIFLKNRPDIVVYNKVKHLSLYDKFCGYAGQSLTKTESYTIAKLIELEYKLVVPQLMLPLSVTESYVLYDETRSKFLTNFLGTYSPCGMYDTVLGRLQTQASSRIDVPPGLTVGQHDNDQLIPKTYNQQAYCKQQVSIINANCHISCDAEDTFQYRRESYPGHQINRDLTQSEIDHTLPTVLQSYKGCFRSTRQKSVATVIEHLKSNKSHEYLTELFKSIENEFSGNKVCTRCNITTIAVAGRKCACGGSLRAISEEVIFNKFKERAKKELNCRYNPGAGFAPQVDPSSKQSILIPGDPDVIPPTTKTNIATIINTSGFRAGVNQVLGKLQIDTTVPSGRISYWIGSDMYLYIISRDLCKSVFTHVPCQQSFKGLDRINDHLKTCTAPMSFVLDPIYKVPGLKDSVYTFGWALFIDGLWHLEFNASMRISSRILEPLLGDKFANLFGRKTPKAIKNFWSATDHHKGNFVLETIYLAGKFVLMKTYMDHNQEPYSATGYFDWICDRVRNQYIQMLNQLIMGTLESYFQFKVGVKSGDVEMMMGGLLEIEKIFFFKKSNRNYQQSSSYRAGDLIKMPSEMSEKRIKFQTTAATAYNSVKIPGENKSVQQTCSSLLSAASNLSKFEEVFKYPVKQGNDAALEQVIKRSKKAAKIINMDKKGWNTEFRTMSSNIALKKKLDRDLGKLSTSGGGNYVRKNLAEIVMVEVVLDKSGWMEGPDVPRDSFTNLAGDRDLNEDLVNFWVLCGQNRDTGLKQLLEKKAVDFKDICALKSDKDEQVKDVKTMLLEIPQMLDKIPENHHMKVFFQEYFELELRVNRNSPAVANFYNNIQQILSDMDNFDSDDENISDSESDAEQI